MRCGCPTQAARPHTAAPNGLRQRTNGWGEFEWEKFDPAWLHSYGLVQLAVEPVPLSAVRCGNVWPRSGRSACGSRPRASAAGPELSDRPRLFARPLLCLPISVPAARVAALFPAPAGSPGRAEQLRVTGAVVVARPLEAVGKRRPVAPGDVRLAAKDRGRCQRPTGSRLSGARVPNTNARAWRGVGGGRGAGEGRRGEGPGPRATSWWQPRGVSTRK